MFITVRLQWFETFQGLIHADMDLDIKAKEQLHPVVLQLECGTQTWNRFWLIRLGYPLWNPLSLVPFNLKLNWLFNGIGLIHFGSVFLEIFSSKVNLIKNSGNIFGTPYFEVHSLNLR